MAPRLLETIRRNNWTLLRLRITAIFPPIWRCVIGKYIRTCNSLSALTGNSLALESLRAARVQERVERSVSPVSVSRVRLGQFSRLGHSLSSLFPILVSLFLTFSVFSLSPVVSLSFSRTLRTLYTNNSSSVSTETSLPAPRLPPSSPPPSFYSLSLAFSFSPLAPLDFV